MPIAHKTLEAINNLTNLFEQDGERRHLGASIIGKQCSRAVWYSFRWARAGQSMHEARLLRLFRRGHREEPEFIAMLRAIGVTVWAAGESGEDKNAMRISDHDGHFGGTPDAVGTDVPDLPKGLAVLLEFKTANEDSFKKMKADGVMAAKWEYFVQMQVYMHKHALTKALFMVVNKNDDEIYTEIVDYNPEIAQRYLDRAKDVIYATEPPPRIADSPAKFPCRFCDFKTICHFSDIPSTNCRTCAHAAVGPAGSWVCAKGRLEIAGQKGCPEHLYDSRFFDTWQVLAGDFDGNWLEIYNGVETFTTGPRKPKGGTTLHYTSAELFADGLVPF